MDFGNRIDQLVIAAGSQIFEPGYAFGAFADGLDDFRARLPAGDHLRQQGRRMLQIAIHGDDHVAVGVFHPAGQRGLKTIIAGQDNGPDAGILLGQPIQHQRRRVFGTVIDVDQFKPIRQRLQIADHFAIQGVNVVLLVENRHRHRNQFLSGIFHRNIISSIPPRFRRIQIRSQHHGSPLIDRLDFMLGLVGVE